MSKPVFFFFFQHSTSFIQRPKNGEAGTNSQINLSKPESLQVPLLFLHQTCGVTSTRSMETRRDSEGEIGVYFSGYSFASQRVAPLLAACPRILPCWESSGSLVTSVLSQVHTRLAGLLGRQSSGQSWWSNPGEKLAQANFRVKRQGRR